MGPASQTSATAEVSRHKCLIYDGHFSQQLPVVVPFLLDGLRQHWRCLYLGSPEMLLMVHSELRLKGVDLNQEAETGALILSSERDHLSNGGFDPQTLVDSLGAMVDQALTDGFEGLYATGDMAWELGSDANAERLLEYEALLDQMFRDRPLRGICQYRRDILPGHAVRQALTTHRSAYIGGSLNRDNLFYIPPELLLDAPEGSAAKQGEWMCQQILRVLDAEQQRDDALAALQESEGRQRRLSSELADMNRHLERRVLERTAELELANKDLESFSSSVSHDLRTPLQSILGFAELLALENSQALGESGRKRVGRVLENAHRMAELIQGPLSLSGVATAGRKREEVNLTEIAEHLGLELREAAPARDTEIAVQPAMRVTGDRALIRAALSNLLGNAWKFTSKVTDARIEFGSINNQSGETVFFVKDNGAGFDMLRVEKLFAPFERLHRDDEFPGTGIGLATVHRIISKHGGRIWAESHPGTGATFFFTLP